MARRAVYEEEFPNGYKAPRQILDLVDSGLLEDTSWRGDKSPSFGAKLKDGNLLRIWVEHPNKSRRKGSPWRYSVFIQKDFESPPDDEIVETDDANEAAFWLRHILAERGLEVKPRFRLLGQA